MTEQGLRVSLYVWMCKHKTHCLFVGSAVLRILCYFVGKDRTLMKAHEFAKLLHIG